MAKKRPIKSPIGAYLRQDVSPPEWLRDKANTITPEVEAELKALGFTVPEWVQVKPYDPEKMKGAVYLCRAIDEGDPESLPDNLVGKCAFCSTRIEYRPTAPKEIIKICGECAKAKATSHEN